MNNLDLNNEWNKDQKRPIPYGSDNIPGYQEFCFVVEDDTGHPKLGWKILTSHQEAIYVYINSWCYSGLDKMVSDLNRRFDEVVSDFNIIDDYFIERTEVIPNKKSIQQRRNIREIIHEKRGGLKTIHITGKITIDILTEEEMIIISYLRDWLGGAKKLVEAAKKIAHKKLKFYILVNKMQYLDCSGLSHIIYNCSCLNIEANLILIDGQNLTFL
ncbi:MAG: hypothetical protein QNJ54_01575 [Prochloraceae cyanobacterium]|nr:hypothetical protein [Prochloraceae cyanobacterium]